MQLYHFTDEQWNNLKAICWETPIHKAPCFACAPARPNLYYRILTKANPCLLWKHLIDEQSLSESVLDTTLLIN